MVKLGEGDGVDHINVFSRGKTWLGRQLTNFAHTPFYHLDKGFFASVEAYWYWLGVRDDTLRPLWGAEAKKVGRELRKTKPVLEVPHFEREILNAIASKLMYHPEIEEALYKATLPLRHYYVFGDKIVIPKVNDQFILDFYNQVRGNDYEAV